MRAEDAISDGRIYRYTVRADRETMHRIEKAAKASGKSTTEFVQHDFETILDRAKLEPDRPAAIAKGTKPETHEVETARSLGITVGGLRLHKAMMAMSDFHGHCQRHYTDLAIVSGLCEGSVRTMLKALTRAKLIKSVAPARHDQPATYVVHRIGDDA
jgi:hypothetical protein